MVPAFPLPGALLNVLFGRLIGRRAHWIAVPALAASFIAACSVAGRMASGGPFTTTLFTWIVAGDFEAGVTASVDSLTAIMLLVVTGVGFLIHLYSIGYMHDDDGYARFFAYLNMFVFSMTMLVLAGNFLLLYVFWEAVGLCSYLLIGFWYERESAARAGKKAFIVNRVGDFGFGLAIMWIWTTLGTLDYAAVFKGAETFAPATATGIALLLFMGACGKSAQIPLHVWLPDAMEGPTPVSALIHAATMVTAGVYMVARSHVIFERSGVALDVVAVIGTLTALFAATIGITQTDIKKVLAYSTISQLGYMFLACGVAAFSAGIFHLMTHAFFKGLLFLAAGSVIHAVGGEQDMRKMGGLREKIPWTFWTMTAGTFAIAGIPPLAGFFSKDEILWRAYQASWAYWLIGLFTAFLTSFYMFRLWFLTFFGKYRGDLDAAHGNEPPAIVAHSQDAHASAGHSHGHSGIHESPRVMLIPLALLAVLSIVGGWVGVPGSLGGSNRFDKFLGPVFHATAPRVNPEHSATGEAAPPEQQTEGPEPQTNRSTELIFTGISVLVAFLGLGLAYLLYYKRPDLPERIAASLGTFYNAVVQKYYVDELYAVLFVKPLVDGSTRILWRGIDQGVIDNAVNESADGARHVSDNARHMQSGNLRSYAGWIALGSAVVIAYMLWMGAR